MNDLSFTPKGHPQQYPQLTMFDAPQLHLFTPVVERQQASIKCAGEPVTAPKPANAEEEAKTRINALRGKYTFISPYHKKQKLLPFNVLGWSYQNGEYLVEVDTVEYRGYEREEVTNYYKVTSVRHKIQSGFLTKL